MLQENETRVKPPKIIQTLVQGFNLVASHPYIMLFPLILDLFFWFGPFYRVKELFTPALEEIIKAISSSASSSLSTSDIATTLQSAREMWDQVLNNFNVLSTLRTYPLGIPSLLASKAYTANPMGNPKLIELTSSSQASLLVVLCIFIGIFLGGIYFALVSRMVTEKQNNEKKGNILQSVAQTFVMYFLILLVVFILAFPIMCFLSSFSTFIPPMGSIPTFMLGLILLWIAVPFVFTPHGIFMKQLSATKAFSLSSKFVKISSLATTLFLTLTVSLSYGLDLLWSTPKPDSWLCFLGILGHAFISSGLLTASFVYFHDGTLWMEEIIKLGPQHINNGTNI